MNLPPKNFTVAIPVATQVLHAVGAAWAAKIKKQSIASVVYFGDGATSEGDFHEGMNFAGVFRTPTVFICQNNQYAISLPREKQTASKTLAQKALAYGFEGIQVDGNDVLAVYSATKAALDKARSGGGPTLIECFTYRLGAHTTSDDPTKYRKKEEEEEWRKKDPVKRFRIYLEKKGIWSQNYEENLLKEVTAEIEKAVEEAEAHNPDVENMFKYVYAEITPNLKEQMDELLGFYRKKEGGLKMAKLNMVQAINLALHEEMEKDTTVVVMGEDVGVDGGVFRVTEGLLNKFGSERVIDTPLAESGIVGTAIGMRFQV